MLLFDDSKKLEKALGEDAASVIAHVFERADEKWRQEIATKADLKDEMQKLRVEIADVKHEILKWIIGLAIAQSALVIAIVSFLR